MASDKLTEALVLLSQSLKENIAESNSNHTEAIDQLRNDYKRDIEELKHQQGRIIENINKKQAKEITEIDNEYKNLIENLTEKLTEAHDEIFILKEKDGESSIRIAKSMERLDVLENENQNLLGLKKGKETKIEYLEKTLEKLNDGTATTINKLEEQVKQHKEAIKELTEKLTIVTESNEEMHKKLAENHQNNVNQLRQEVVDQINATKEISRNIKVEFVEKLKMLSNILDGEKTSNEAKIGEIRDVLDGLKESIHTKMEAASTDLMGKIKTELNFNSKGSEKYGMDMEIALVKELLDSLTARINNINDQMYDFELSKRNNLIFYGVPNDPEETKLSLASKMSAVVRNVIGIRREIVLSGVYRLFTGPDVMGCRPITVTFQHFRDREDVLRRAVLLKESNIHVTEDMNRSVRECRAHLARFMKKVKKNNVNSSCFILYDKLYVDNKMYVWDPELGQVREGGYDKDLGQHNELVANGGKHANSRAGQHNDPVANGGKHSRRGKDDRSSSSSSATTSTTGTNPSSTSISVSVTRRSHN